MSQEVVNNTNNQAQVDTDVSKIFVNNNRYENATYEKTNSTYDDIVLPVGTLMGRIATSQKVIPLASGASDGSQYPVGVLAEEVTVPAGESVSKSVSICVAGDVVQGKITLDGSDTLATVISARSIFDRIQADTVGIKLVGGTEMTDFDNQ